VRFSFPEKRSPKGSTDRLQGRHRPSAEKRGR